MKKTPPEKENALRQRIADMVTERPRCFTVKGGYYYLWPPSVGSLMLLSASMEALGADAARMAAAPFVEHLRLCSLHPQQVARMIAQATLRGYPEVFDERKLSRRARLFGDALGTEELAKLLMLVLAQDGVEDIQREAGMDRERERLSKVASLKAREAHAPVTIGARTIYGTLIDNACRTYGWTMHYAVWGISYANLRMLAADAPVSITLSADEQRKLRIYPSRKVIDGDRPQDAAALRNFFS